MSTQPLPNPRLAGGGVEIDVLVQPRASRSGLVGVHDGRFKVRLAAPPVDGAANEALIELVAKTVGVPRAQVTVLRGASSRRKTLLVQGPTPEAVGAALAGGER